MLLALTSIALVSCNAISSSDYQGVVDKYDGKESNRASFEAELDKYFSSFTDAKFDVHSLAASKQYALVGYLSKVSSAEDSRSVAIEHLRRAYENYKRKILRAENPNGLSAVKIGQILSMSLYHDVSEPADYDTSRLRKLGNLGKGKLWVSETRSSGGVAVDTIGLEFNGDGLLGRSGTFKQDVLIHIPYGNFDPATQSLKIDTTFADLHGGMTTLSKLVRVEIEEPPEHVDDDDKLVCAVNWYSDLKIKELDTFVSEAELKLIERKRQVLLQGLSEVLPGKEDWSPEGKSPAEIKKNTDRMRTQVIELKKKNKAAHELWSTDLLSLNYEIAAIRFLVNSANNNASFRHVRSGAFENPTLAGCLYAMQR